MSRKKIEKRNLFFFILDKNFKHHPGLADRLKAITSCYYIARNNGYEFKLIDQTACGIKDFLIPEQRTLLASEEDLEFSLFDTKLFYYSASTSSPQTRLKPDKQYHCYCYQGDDLFFHNGGDYIKKFNLLFNELFSPTPILIDLINATGLQEKQYVAIHSRFVNSLGSFESSRYPTLKPQQQEDLINRCLNGILNICNKEDKDVVLFSDSKLFLEHAKILPVRILDTKNISHISINNNRSVLAKTYLDFMLISRAAKVYRLCSNEKELHLTNFSYYAAFAGGIEASDVEV